MIRKGSPTKIQSQQRLYQLSQRQNRWWDNMFRPIIHRTIELVIVHSPGYCVQKQNQQLRLEFLDVGQPGTVKNDY